MTRPSESHRRLSALAVALIYNWCSLFVRLGNSQARLEAITSRPLLLSPVARQTTHGGAKHLTITSQPTKDAIDARHYSWLVTQFKGAARQFKTTSVWQLVCEHILSTIARYEPKIRGLLSRPPSALDSLNCFFEGKRVKDQYPTADIRACGMVYAFGIDYLCPIKTTARIFL
jgi:hypothetical protein